VRNALHDLEAKGYVARGVDKRWRLSFKEG
jgi:hypothetical protein